MTTCAIRKRILFIASSSPFLDEQNYQTARMALSVVMDAEPRLLLKGAALPLAFHPGSIFPPLYDFFEQERFLREMHVPIMVRARDVERSGRGLHGLRSGVAVLDREDEAKLYAEMDHILNF